MAVVECSESGGGQLSPGAELDMAAVCHRLNLLHLQPSTSQLPSAGAWCPLEDTGDLTTAMASRSRRFRDTKAPRKHEIQRIYKNSFQKEPTGKKLRHCNLSTEHWVLHCLMKRVLALSHFVLAAVQA